MYFFSFKNGKGRTTAKWNFQVNFLSLVVPLVGPRENSQYRWLFLLLKLSSVLFITVKHYLIFEYSIILLLRSHTVPVLHLCFASLRFGLLGAPSSSSLHRRFGLTQGRFLSSGIHFRVNFAHDSSDMRQTWPAHSKYSIVKYYPIFHNNILDYLNNENCLDLRLGVTS